MCEGSSSPGQLLFFIPSPVQINSSSCHRQEVMHKPTVCFMESGTQLSTHQDIKMRVMSMHPCRRVEQKL